MDIIDTEILKKIQSIELETLILFDSICKKYDIRYFLFGGTLLGAVRHHGFIPWDDDIDVAMLRRDYDRFITICSQDELGDLYFLQTTKTDPNTIIQFAKIRRNGTVYEPFGDTSLDSHKGIWIDIFPLDNVHDGTKDAYKQYFEYNFYYTLLTSSFFSRVKRCKSLIKKCGRFALFLFTKVLNRNSLIKKLEKIMRKYESEDTKYVNHLSNGTSSNRPERYLMKKEDCFDLIALEFEGNVFPCPRNYDEVLRRCYGDYMVLPPESERKPNHGVIRIQFSE